MNAFNLADLAAARTRLDRAVSLSPPDADAYYSRGELLRDTARPQASRDFQRYLALTEATCTEHPTKRDRVHTLINLLQACQVDATPQCDAHGSIPEEASCAFSLSISMS